MSRVLVVDQDPKVRRAVDQVLTRAGYHVESASSLDEATRRVQHSTLDMALLGQVEGNRPARVAERLRSLQPSCLRVLLTSPHDADTRDALERGVALTTVSHTDQAQMLRRLAQAERRAARLSAMGESQFQAARVVERQQLLDCLQQRRLKIALQPMVTIDDREPVAHEVLLRCDHPLLRTPHAVLAVASRHGLMEPVSSHIAALAAATHRPGTPLSLNLHPSELNHPQRLVASLAPLHHAAPDLLLELPAVSPVEHLGPPAARLLRRLGFRLALDNVRLDDCLLPALSELRPSLVKLDMALVRDLHLHAAKQRRVSLIVRLAASIGAQVVGQGVEREPELTALRELGVTLAQGFLIGRPQIQTSRRTP